jgi:hypothetical protein
VRSGREPRHQMYGSAALGSCRMTVLYLLSSPFVLTRFAQNSSMITMSQ